MHAQPANDAQIVQLIIEVAIRVNAKKAVRKAQSKLENQLRKWFSKQHVAFQKGFKKFEHSFKESVTDDNIDTVFDNATDDATISADIQQAIEDGLQIGADWLVDELGMSEYTFDLENPRAVEYTKDYGAELVTKLNEFSKQQLRTILHDGISNGWSYSKIATAFRQKFADFSTRRAKLIAVTELGNAYQEGNLIVGKDLSDAGLNIEKAWLTVGDDRVDPNCSANADDGWIDVNASHSSGKERPLDHPSCRCVERYRRVGSNIQ